MALDIGAIQRGGLDIGAIQSAEPAAPAAGPKLLMLLGVGNVLPWFVVLPMIWSLL